VESEGFADEGRRIATRGLHYVATYALLGLFYANGFNLMRAVDNDISVGRDWFRPLILSSLIYAEGNYRSKIGLPSLLGDGDTAFYHLSFAHLVARGERNPLFVWEDTVRRPHPYQAKAAWCNVIGDRPRPSTWPSAPILKVPYAPQGACVCGSNHRQPVS